MSKKEPTVNIPVTTFSILCKYFLFEQPSPELANIIKADINKKFDDIAIRETYGKAKKAKTAEERKKFMNAYLDMKGVPPQYRW